MPKNYKIFEQVSAIALHALAEEPRRFVETMRLGINVTKYETFWKRCNFATLLDMQKVTPNNVANCLKSFETVTNKLLPSIF